MSNFVKVFSLFALVMALPVFAGARIPVSAPARLAQVDTFPVWGATTSYTVGSVATGSDGNLYRCLVTGTAPNPVSDSGSSWEAYFVRTADLILECGSNGSSYRFKGSSDASDPAGILKAIGFIKHATISKARVVTIHVNNGTYTYNVSASSIWLDHPNGDQIKLIGNTSSPSSVVLNAGINLAPSGGLISIHGDIALIDGFLLDGTGVTLDGSNQPITTSKCWGIHSNTAGSNFVIGSHMIIRNFGIQGAIIGEESCYGVVSPSITYTNNFIGVFAFRGAHMIVNGGAFSTNVSGANHIRADVSSIMECYNASLTGGQNGFLAFGLSYMILSGNTNSGVTVLYSPTPGTSGNNNSWIYSN